MQHNISIQLDDRIYRPLMERVGEENLNQFISNLIEPYLLVNRPTTEVEFKKKSCQQGAGNGGVFSRIR